MKPKTVIPIAVTDSYAMVRKGISSFITASGKFNVVIEAASGRKLLAQLQQAQTLPAICILDIDMPAMDGYETLVEIKETWPGMKVMVLGLFPDPLIIRTVVQDGAVGYLHKDSEPGELVNALLSIHNKGFYDAAGFSDYLLNAGRHTEHSFRLTEKEKQLLRHVDTDLSYTEIAKLMGTSPRSVQGYRDRLFSKLHVHSRSALVRYAIKFGICSLS